MKKLIIILCLATLSLQASEITLVENGKSDYVIVKENKTYVCNFAAKLLQRVLKKSTKAEIPVIDAKDARKSKAQKIFVGWGKNTAKAGFKLKDLRTEEYINAVRKGNLYLFGRDGRANKSFAKLGKGSYYSVQPATLWAVSNFLDDKLGVLWIWPGKSGEYVPKHRAIKISSEMNVKKRPKLQNRGIGGRSLPPAKTYAAKDKKKLVNFSLEQFSIWGILQQLGRREVLGGVHSFKKWRKKYYKKYPQVFAKKPKGKTKSPRIGWEKLCLSEPKTSELILKEWRKAGKPSYYPVCPNDGVGFCTCSGCRTMDKANYKLTDIWNGKADLGRRYILFINNLQRKMRKENPKTSIMTLAYSCYKYPPEDIKIEPGIIVKLVVPYTEGGRKIVNRWKRDGAQLILRPNWWYMLNVAPFWELHKQGEFFKEAYGSMISFMFDANTGCWGPNSPAAYLITRLACKPEMTVDQVIDEYCSAFGAAAPEIRKYIDYWEKYSTYLKVSIPAGGVVVQDPNGPYVKIRKKYNLAMILRSSWQALPYLYPDKVIEPAQMILKKAETKVASDPDALSKVKYLQATLEHLKATRDCYAAANSIVGKVSNKESEKMYKDLIKLRRKLNKDCVIFEAQLDMVEKRRRIKLSKSSKKINQDMSGM